MINALTLLTLLSVLSNAQGKGSDGWCVHQKKYLRTYSSGVHSYTRLHIARRECSKRDDCFGLTSETNGKWTLRKDWKLMDTTDDVTSVAPCKGYFSCHNFGLKTAQGNFLSMESDGTLTADSKQYGKTEKLHFKQWGTDSGFIISYSGKYLRAMKDGKVVETETKMATWNKFTLYQDLDRIAIESYHGKHLSAKSDGSVLADVGSKTDLEWFEVYPQSCLNNIECDCPEKLDSNIYYLSSVTFDHKSGSVKKYRPERVGYQYIDNKDSSVEQSSTFTVSEQVDETKAFTHTAGVEVMVGTEFNCGVPLVASGSVSVEVTAGYEFSYGTEKTVSKMMQADYNCVAAAGKIVTCQAYLFKYK